MKKCSEVTVLLFFLIPVFIWSAINPYDRFTWWMEVFPVILALPFLFITRRSFPLSFFTCVLILLHMIILLVGGHYTYARVPLFDWLRNIFHFQRNHFDRLGHLAQGFVPAVIAREILLRQGIIKTQGWLIFFVICFCLALSAIYELLECATALIKGEAANDFLGSQGDVWDTQMDMAFCLFGAVFAMAFFRRMHDRSLSNLKKLDKN